MERFVVTRTHTMALVCVAGPSRYGETAEEQVVKSICE